MAVVLPGTWPIVTKQLCLLYAWMKKLNIYFAWLACCHTNDILFQMTTICWTKSTPIPGFFCFYFQFQRCCFSMNVSICQFLSILRIGSGNRQLLCFFFVPSHCVESCLISSRCFKLFLVLEHYKALSCTENAIPRSLWLVSESSSSISAWYLMEASIIISSQLSRFC